MKEENFLQTNDEVNDLLDSIGANTHVTEIQRLGKILKDRQPPSVVLVTLANKHAARITLAKKQEFINNLVERNIYILPA